MCLVDRSQSSKPNQQISEVVRLVFTLRCDFIYKYMKDVMLNGGAEKTMIQIEYTSSIT